MINGTLHVLGYVKGIAAIHTPGSVTTYAAAQEVGLLSADVGSNSPQPRFEDRLPEGAAYGNYIDVVAIRDHLFALDIDRGVLDVFTPTLGTIGSASVQLENQIGRAHV